MVKVIRDMEVRVGREVYTKGKNISGLTSEQEARIVEKGYCEYTGDTSACILEEPKTPTQTNKSDSIAEMTVPEALKVIEKINDLEGLRALLETEEAGNNRKGVIKVLTAKIEELEEAEDDEEGEAEGEITFNLGDSID